MPATQYDIAHRTGLSQATISRALKGDEAVNPATRDRVLNACKELGYRPSIGGRVLAEGQRAVIGISLSNADLETNRYVTVMHQALLTALGASGYGVSLLAPETLEQHIHHVGMVLLVGAKTDDPRVELCKAAGKPFVVIGYINDPTVFSVVPDDDDGGRQVAQHFHRIGRQNMMIMSSLHIDLNQAKAKRALAATRTAQTLGLSVMQIDTQPSPTDTLSGYRTIMHAAPEFVAIDCLFCDTDELALGAITALQDLGHQVPGDINVAGFDDLPGLSDHLTTVRQPFHAIAQGAIDLRAAAISGASGRHIVVPVNLMVRDT